jgi:prepilin-type N-terminal cleavage/methylation domain-containing protein
MKKAFTLIELLMVIAIIGIIATLAVTKIGNTRRVSAMKVSVANQAAVERAFESYLTMNGGQVNRLDSLMYKEGVVGAPGGGFNFAATNTARTAGMYLYQGPAAPAEFTAAEEGRNAGMTPGLRNLFVPYAISKPEAYGFSVHMGMKYVMCHMRDATRSAKSQYGDRAVDGDGSYLPDDAEQGWSPECSACVAQVVTNGLYVAVVNPATAAGRSVYRDCGQELMDTESNDGAYDADACIREAKATGGLLFAFGLGENCSAIGKGQAGLESAPYSEFPLPRFYRHYVLLFRLNAAKSQIPEFAGVLDPCGLTIRAARNSLANL